MVSNIHSHACWTFARRIRSIRSATVCGALGLRFALESRVVEVRGFLLDKGLVLLGLLASFAHAQVLLTVELFCDLGAVRVKRRNPFMC